MAVSGSQLYAGSSSTLMINALNNDAPLVSK
jgi:hypothetical protein